MDLYIQLQVPEPPGLSDVSAEPETEATEDTLMTWAGSDASESLARSSVRLIISQD